MKIAYFDCFSGISGDMTIGALIDAGVDFETLKNELSKLQLPGVEVICKKVLKNNITATKFEVICKHPDHSHRNLLEMATLIENSFLSDSIKEKGISILNLIAGAEAKIHNLPVEELHFHEIGAMDTIVDVAGALISMDLLGIEKIYSSPLNTGRGFVTFSHGTFPVPAPATAELLKNIPIYSKHSEGELVTPTGAALIRFLAENFGNLPEMVVEATGYGAGTKDFDLPNVLRIFIGSEKNRFSETDRVFILETNIDDMNPQYYEEVFDKLFENNALDVFLSNITMKKGRPAQKLTVLVKEENIQDINRILFTHTTSIGIRFREEKRIFLERESALIETPLGKLRIKKTFLRGEIVNNVPEYEDLKQIAKKENLSIKSVYEKLKSYF